MELHPEDAAVLRRDDRGQPPIDLLRPFDSTFMQAWRVDAAVGNVRNNAPELLEPVPSQTLF